MILTTHRPMRLLALLPLLLLPCCAAANETATDQTLSPYFSVSGDHEDGAETLPLEETSAQVDIAGVIAAVKIRQVYRNRGDSPIEAVYVFPGSTRAAVNAMTMTVGERKISAQIKERQAAKTSYLQAKNSGKRASLLEQQRPNVFQMKVANIMPGDRVVVELAYSELIVPEQGVYEFVYPAVVGPRYSEIPASAAADSDAWIANPYLHQGEQSPYTFDIKVSLAAGLPIQAVMSPSHDVDVAYDQAGAAAIRLKSAGADNGNRDFVLRYQLRGKRIETGLLLHEGEQENFFLLLSQPPERVENAAIPPREYIFVVDVSGSMHGFPLDISKKLMVELLTRLRPSDRFNILFFSGGSALLADNPIAASKANIDKAIAMMESQRGGGGTRLLPALRRAMNQPAESGVSRSFVVVTDGYIAIETEVFDYVRNNLNNANFFAFGIGSGVNRFLIEGLARSGRGEPFVITSPDEALPIAQRFRNYIQTPVLTDIEIDFDGFTAYDVEPLHVPDLFAERPLVVFGKWRGKAEGKINVAGRRGEADYFRSLDVAEATNDMDNEALRYLWARQRIADLGDYQKLRPDSERKEEITTLGLTYNLLTAYTSFVAIDEVVANPSGGNRTVKQALPLPQGVGDLAVGGIVPTTPEPEMTALLAVLALLALGAWLRQRRDDGFAG